MRDRLHRQRPAVGQAPLGDAEEGAEEGQRAVAVVAGPLGKQHQIVADGEAARDRIALIGGAARLAVDEDRALQARQRSEERPARHFGLGDEADRDQSGEDLDIDIGAVIGDEQRRAGLLRRPAQDDFEAEEPADAAVVDDGHALGHPAAESDADGLKRDQDERRDQIGDQQQRRADRRMQAEVGGIGLEAAPAPAAGLACRRFAGLRPFGHRIVVERHEAAQPTAPPSPFARLSSARV